MKIIVIHKSRIESIPPVISLLINITDLGYETELITCGISNANRKFFEDRKVKITTFPLLSDKGVLSKVLDYIKFNIYTYQYLKKCDPRNNILIIEGAHTLVSLGQSFKKMGFRYILMLPEYIEKGWYQIYAVGRVIGQAAAVLVPEYNRCHFFRIKYGLKELPVLFPNKPYFEPELASYSSFENQYKDLIHIFKTKKVILYQGHIAESRDVSSVIKAVKNLGEDYRMVLLGKDYGVIENYRKIDENIIHVPFIPAPNYLYLTQMAYIGILFYDPLLFNTVYCAPNKIYEYTKYGLPVIGNNIPGIHYPLTIYEFGFDVDFSRPDDIKDAILKISRNYEEFSKNAKRFFEQTDNKNTIKQVLTKIEKI